MPTDDVWDVANSPGAVTGRFRNEGLGELPVDNSVFQRALTEAANRVRRAAEERMASAIEGLSPLGRGPLETLPLTQERAMAELQRLSEMGILPDASRQSPLGRAVQDQAEEIRRMTAQRYPVGDAHVGERVPEQMRNTRQDLATRNLRLHYGAVDPSGVYLGTLDPAHLELPGVARSGRAAVEAVRRYDAIEHRMRECEAILDEMRASGITIDRRAVADLEAGIARGEPLDPDRVRSCVPGPSAWEHILDEDQDLD